MRATARMFTHLHQSCPADIEIDDFRQRVLLRAVEYGNTFRGETNAEMLGWLRAIGRQLTAQFRRAAHRPPAHALVQDVVEQGRKSATENAAIAEEQAAEVRWLGKMLADMGRKDRELLEQHYLTGNSLAAIAVSLGLTRNAVTQRRGRILARLRRLWQVRDAENK
jgi:RNA polymerase sigma factor (sigma-70 family)